MRARDRRTRVSEAVSVSEVVSEVRGFLVSELLSVSADLCTQHRCDPTKSLIAESDVDDKNIVRRQ